MKEYTYFGNLHKDINQLKKKGNFDWKKFGGLSLLVLISIILAGSIMALIVGKITSTIIGSLTGVYIYNTIKNIKDSRQPDLYNDKKVINLYKEINEEYSDNIYDHDVKEKIKKCISVKKSNKIVEVTNTINSVMSDEEKIVRYFYLLDPKDQIQVLRQIKDEYTKVYLLDNYDIKRENLEIPVQKIFRKK